MASFLGHSSFDFCHPGNWKLNQSQSFKKKKISINLNTYLLNHKMSETVLIKIIVLRS